MIESAIKTALEDITGLPVYPLLLPANLLEGIAYQLISDPAVDTGLIRTRLIAARYQLRFSLLDHYTRLHAIDRAVWEQWRSIRQGDISGVPVQYVLRGGITEQCSPQVNGSMLYSIVRDYTLYYREEDS